MSTQLRWRMGIAALAAACIVVAMAGEEESKAPRYADRRRLMVVREGDVERPIRDPADWRLRREHVLLGMEEVMGPFPWKPIPARDDPRDPPAWTVHEEAPPPSGATFTRRRISFDSRGDPVPAWLLVPARRDGPLAREGKLPAVLCLHQTTPVGKGEPAGLGGKESLHYAAHLAARGFVALAPDYPGFGDHRFDALARGYRSGSMKAIQDNVRAVDLLRSLPEVDPERIGCLGHSLGGHNALFTAAFDVRIRVVVTSCAFTAFGRYMGGDLAGWSSRTYMPRIPSYGGWRNVPFDFHEVVAALAPRPFLAIAPVRDSNFEVEGVREVMEAAGQVYRLLGAAEKLSARYPDGEHDFPPASREAAYRWLERWLAPPGAGERGG